jgi:hypothetical protein
MGGRRVRKGDRVVVAAVGMEGEAVAEGGVDLGHGQGIGEGGPGQRVGVIVEGAQGKRVAVGLRVLINDESKFFVREEEIILFIRHFVCVF